MPKITLPDGTIRNYEKPVSIIEIATDIGPGLAKAAIAGIVSVGIITGDPSRSFIDKVLASKAFN